MVRHRLLLVMAVWVCLLMQPRPAVADELLLDAPQIIKALYYSMLQSLPLQYQALGVNIRLHTLMRNVVNARAAYDDGGTPSIDITPPMMDVMLRVSFYVAEARLGHLDSDLRSQLHRTKPSFYASGQLILPLPTNWRTRASDPTFRAVWASSLRSVSCLVLGHELGHHCLGHTAGLLHLMHMTPVQASTIDLHAKLEHQQKELEADTFGIYAVGWNRLDYSSALIFCRYMGLLEPEMHWPYFGTHPGWRTRERNLRIIVESLR